MFQFQNDSVPDQGVRRCGQLVQFGQEVVVVRRGARTRKCRTVVSSAAPRAAIVHVVEVAVVVIFAGGRRRLVGNVDLVRAVRDSRDDGKCD